ncbi:MAG: hypothetical protein K5668_10270 [Lachnospiraceae bacterium]|nr:hypothetical protein [Lachnospiraceae bacterium]
MSALSVVKDAVVGNTGNIEKAIIEIVDVRHRANFLLYDSLDIQGSSAESVSVRSLGSPDSQQTMMNKGLMSDAMKDMAGVSADIVSDEQVDSITGAQKRLFMVQFNPTTLQLSGHSGGLIQELDYSAHGKERSASYSVGNTTISLSVNLLFDSCDPQDAFMSDKMNLSPTAVGTGIAKGVMTGLGKKQVTVQKQVEGFISALRNRFTRLITFHWGEFNYSGILRNVGATYTMFNVTGEPVRASVDLSIMCADKEMYPNSLAVWQERYKKAFKLNKSRSYVKAEQKVGNLLNL